MPAEDVAHLGVSRKAEGMVGFYWKRGWAFWSMGVLKRHAVLFGRQRGWKRKETEF